MSSPSGENLSYLFILRGRIKLEPGFPPDKRENNQNYAYNLEQSQVKKKREGISSDKLYEEAMDGIEYQKKR